MAEPEDQGQLPVLYTNSVRIGYSIYDFSMLLGLQGPSPDPKAKEDIIQVAARVIMSPTHFKKFISLGTTVIADYEAKHGPIPEEQQKTKKTAE